MSGKKENSDKMVRNVGYKLHDNEYIDKGLNDR